MLVANAQPWHMEHMRCARAYTLAMCSQCLRTYDMGVGVGVGVGVDVGVGVCGCVSCACVRACVRACGRCVVKADACPDFDR